MNDCNVDNNEVCGATSNVCECDMGFSYDADKNCVEDSKCKDVIFQVHMLKILWAHRILNLEMSRNESISIFKTITKLRKLNNAVGSNSS